MGTVSGINDAEVAALMSEIDGIRKQVQALFEELTTQTVGSIAEHYSGDAADSYKSRFTTLSNKADETFAHAIKTMNNKLQEFREGYGSQDKINADSSSFMG